MKKKVLRRDMIEPLIIGGTILGGGGGGSINRGREMANLAFDIGTPFLADIEDLNDQDTVITVSSVGAPAAKKRYVQPIDYVTAVNMLQNYTGVFPTAIISNENGGSATVNGFIQSAVLGIPILDAPSNGRAHPTGIMGSMNLTSQADYKSVQVSVGGYPGTMSRVSQVVEGSIQTCSELVRQTAVKAGGLVAVARNPIPVSYLKKNAALGAFTQAYDVGRAHASGKTPIEKVNNVLRKVDGTMIGQGKVKNLEIKTINGFDLGSFEVLTDSDSMVLTFWNEYITCEQSGKRLSTFPDLLMTYSVVDGMPITSAELAEDDDIFITTAPYSNLLLGSGMFNQSNYEIIETTLGKEIIRYIEPIFLN